MSDCEEYYSDEDENYSQEAVTHVYVAHKEEKSILNDLLDLDIPDHIKKSANSVYRNLIQKTRRNARRKKMIFFCLREAYQKEKEVMDPREIGSLLGLSKNEIKSANSMFSESQSGYQTRIIYNSPLDYIDIYCQKLNLNESIITEIENFCKNIIIKHDKETGMKPQNFPQNIAAGTILYYLSNINVINLNTVMLEKISFLSLATIKNVAKKIGYLHNL